MVFVSHSIEYRMIIVFLLQIHVQKLHQSDQPVVCKKCDKSFADRYLYNVVSIILYTMCFEQKLTIQSIGMSGIW